MCNAAHGASSNYAIAYMCTCNVTMYAVRGVCPELTAVATNEDLVGRALREAAHCIGELATGSEDWHPALLQLAIQNSPLLSQSTSLGEYLGHTCLSACCKLLNI